jgi:ketosteroid isomerase-like protein
MKIRLLLAALAILGELGMLAGGPTARPDDSRRSAILRVLSEQTDAWNRGNVAGFMKGYWNSPELTFAGSSGITRGWQPVLDRYRKNYPDQKMMGHLEFSNLEVRSLGTDDALVIGQWHLQREADQLGGVFTLVLQRFPDGWKIIHDHTSADARKPQ